MKYARVVKYKTGYWMIIDEKANQVGSLYDDEASAILAANSFGYLVRS